MQLVALHNGIRNLDSAFSPGVDASVVEAVAAAVESGDATPEMVERMERLNRECAVLEGRLQYRSDNQMKAGLGHFSRYFAVKTLFN